MTKEKRFIIMLDFEQTERFRKGLPAKGKLHDNEEEYTGEVEITPR